MENIKHLLLKRNLLCIVLVAFSFIIGCSASDKAVEDEYTSDDTSGDSAVTGSISKGKQSSPRFNVQADTLTVHPRKKGMKENSSVGVRTSVSKKYYSVQIGAYRLKSNLERNYALCLKRFKQPIIKFYEPGIKMDRLCVGHFATAKEAKNFAKSIQEQYPKEYKEVWVTVLHHE